MVRVVGMRGNAVGGMRGEAWTPGIKGSSRGVGNRSCQRAFTAVMVGSQLSGEVSCTGPGAPGGGGCGGQQKSRGHVQTACSL